MSRLAQDWSPFPACLPVYLVGVRNVEWNKSDYSNICNIGDNEFEAEGDGIPLDLRS